MRGAAGVLLEAVEVVLVQLVEFGPAPLEPAELLDGALLVEAAEVWDEAVEPLLPPKEHTQLSNL